MIKELSVTELQVGHFVVDIAKQHGHYNLTQSANIKSDGVIQNLIAKGVEKCIDRYL